MTGNAESPSFRASDADRVRGVRVLRDSAVEGRLAHDSFVRRIDLALRAHDQRALDDLVADLPSARPVGLPATLRTRMSAFAEQLSVAARSPRQPLLHLPGPRQPQIVIGRGCDCDLVLADLTVSRTHALLRLFGDEWFLEDLGSTNGTRLNGIRIRTASMVRRGDRVSFGRVALRVG
jgi:hypothetical protein